MAIAISPHHNLEDFPGGLTPDQQIQVFIDQISGWQLGIAREMINQNILHRHYAVLHIVTSYFETIAKYMDGYDREDASEKYFNKGLLTVFPEINTLSPGVLEYFLCDFYSRIRCGLYHGSQATGAFLTGDIPGALGYDSTRRLVAINPDLFVNRIEEHFSKYASRLRDSTETALRTNFFRRQAFEASPPKPPKALLKK